MSTFTVYDPAAILESTYRDNCWYNLTFFCDYESSKTDSPSPIVDCSFLNISISTGNEHFSDTFCASLAYLFQCEWFQKFKKSMPMTSKPYMIFIYSAFYKKICQLCFGVSLWDTVSMTTAIISKIHNNFCSQRRQGMVKMIRHFNTYFELSFVPQAFRSVWDIVMSCFYLTCFFITVIVQRQKQNVIHLYNNRFLEKHL